MVQQRCATAQPRAAGLRLSVRAVELDGHSALAPSSLRLTLYSLCRSLSYCLRFPLRRNEGLTGAEATVEFSATFFTDRDRGADATCRNGDDDGCGGVRLLSAVVSALKKLQQ